jgi:hypothetical protein
MMTHFTINLTEIGAFIFSGTWNKKCAKMALKIKTSEQRTIFFKLKRNVKINDESVKRI